MVDGSRRGEWVLHRAMPCAGRPGACGTPVEMATLKTIAATTLKERDGDDDQDRDEGLRSAAFSVKKCRFTLQCGTNVLLYFNKLAETEVYLWAFHLRLLQAFLALKMGLVNRSIDRSIKQCRLSLLKEF